MGIDVLEQQTVIEPTIKSKLKRFRATVMRRYPNGNPEVNSEKHHIFCIRTALKICGRLDRDLLEKITKIPRSTIYDTIKKFGVRKGKLHIPKGRPYIIYYIR